MTRDETQVGVILRELQERAKELNCLYKVDELLNRPDLSLEEIFLAMIGVLPPGWQYPHDCQARIVFEDQVIQPPDFAPAPFVQSANIVVQGEVAGSVEVSYRVQMPKSDEGPFLKEERASLCTRYKQAIMNFYSRGIRLPGSRKRRPYWFKTFCHMPPRRNKRRRRQLLTM